MPPTTLGERLAGAARELGSAVRARDAAPAGRAAARLVGLGTGLTPSGDDFLCGLLAGYRFSQVNLRFATTMKMELVFLNSEGNNLISNSFLRASYEGKVNAKVRRLMLALGRRDRMELAAAAKAALESGHTSGADFCAGLAFALLEELKGLK